MDLAKTLELSCGLARSAGRAEAANRLARHLGADTLLLFIRDPDLGVFLPAQGLPQTIPGGPGWADLLRRCEVPGEHEGAVAFPDRASTCSVRAYSTGDGMIFALLGGRPAPGPLEALCFPLLAAALDATRAELERTLSEMRRLNEELKTADRAKDEFLAMLAHELRNPLSPIVSALDILRHQDPGAPPPARLLDVMDRQARHLTRLVEDLLDVSRISRGLIELRQGPITVVSALHQAIDNARPLLASERHTLSLALPDEELAVVGDSVRLTQVFSNLLTNAAKYTSPGGRIDVSLKREGDLAVLRVRDTGIGIEEDLLPRVFDLFMQAPRALDRSKGGLGIGLTLVQRLVKLHGGSVEARSDGIGKGSEFIVRLRLAVP